jgi:hypothetical protein
MWGINPSLPGFDATSGETAVTTNSSQAVKAAPGAGLSIYVTDLYIVNNHATVDTLVTMYDGATPIWTGFAPAITASKSSVPIDRRFAKPLKVTANAALSLKCATTGANVYWNVSGFINKEFG